MTNKEDVELFEYEFGKIKREGADAVLKYLKEKSDFYTAPSSTKYHLSCPGGLLKHSLNVLDAMRALLTDKGDGIYAYMVAGKEIASISEESLLIVTLLHDICKTRFYTVEMRNKKIDGQWHEIPSYNVDDQLPLGHGEKSVYMISSMMHLNLPETMMIRWHMGMPDDYAGKQTFGTAVEKFPMIWALHTADMQAAHFMEDESGNKELFDGK